MKDDSASQVPEPTETNPLRDAISETRQHWRLLIVFPLLAALLSISISFFVQKQYEAIAIFSPAEDLSSALPANLQSIAAQFGIMPSGNGYNVYYFAQVAQSREVLRLVTNDTLDDRGERIPVIQLLHASGDTPPELVDDAIKRLEKAIRADADDQAELVTIRARAPSVSLAEQLASALLDALNQVTTESIQRGGSAERKFAQAQADSAREALQLAEDQLRDFYQANRSITAPSLQFEEARLRRQIQIRQDLYLALTSQSEAAKLREVKNTPSIALIQPPLAPAKKAWPRRGVWALAALIGALLAALTWLYVIQPLLPHQPPR
jgi:uncharacterized protein involved in exopolysaccharide biosynthesis